MLNQKVSKKKGCTDAEMFRTVFIVSTMLLGVLTVVGVFVYLIRHDWNVSDSDDGISWIPVIGVWIPILTVAASNREAAFEKKHEKLLIASIAIGLVAFVVA